MNGVSCEKPWTVLQAPPLVWVAEEGEGPRWLRLPQCGGASISPGAQAAERVVPARNEPSLC